MFKKQFQHKKKQAGLTLVEVLSAIIVGVLVIVGSLSLYNNTQNKQRENDLMTSLMTIQTNIRDLYYGKNSYPSTAGTIRDTLIVAGGAPQSLLGTDGTDDILVSPYDSSEEIVIAGTGPQFTITIPNVPQESCVSLAGRLGSFESVEAGTTDVTGDSDAAAGACDGGADVTYTSN